MGGLRKIADPFVVPGPSGVAIRSSLKGLTGQDETVLRLVGGLLGSLASRDLKTRCAAGLDHDSEQWAQRKRAVTGESSSRWAGSITKATHDQWALARRSQLAHIQCLEAGVRTIGQRLSLPVGAKGSKGSPGGYRSKQEWFAKSRRLHLLEDRLERERADWGAGRVRVVRGGKKLLRNRHNLPAAQLTEVEWRLRWEAERFFLQADGESGKRYGNETIRVSPEGEVSIKLPAPLAGLANGPHGRYVLAGRVGGDLAGSQVAEVHPDAVERVVHPGDDSCPRIHKQPVPGGAVKTLVRYLVDGGDQAARHQFADDRRDRGPGHACLPGQLGPVQGSLGEE